MRLLLAGIDTPIAKAFIKNYKSNFGLVALDPSKADFSKYEPVKEVFSAYEFDAIIYFASGAGKDLKLFKNLQYASINFGIKKMITVIVVDPTKTYDPLITVGEHTVFDSLVPVFIMQDKIGTALRFYEVYGKGENESVVSKMVTNAKKKNKIEIAQDKQINLLHLSDATSILNTFVTGDIKQGIYDASSPNQTALSAVAKAIKKQLPEVAIEILDRTLAETLELDTDPLVEILGTKFKFTTLNKGIGEMVG